MSISGSGRAVEESLFGVAKTAGCQQSHVIFANKTDMTYDALDMLVRPDHPVAAVAQLTNLPEVSFQDYCGALVRGDIEESVEANPRL